MNFTRWFKSWLPLMLVAVLALSACSSAPSKYDEVQQETTGFNAPAAVEKGAQKGGTFNQFFPASEAAFKVVPSQEKKGFAEYKLKRDGETLAMLTINDTISLPAAAKKYDAATNTVAGFPTVEQGNTATGVLVNGRYQVKVLSRSDAFTAEDRVTWLEKFDWEGLSALEADTKAFRKVQKKQAVRAQKSAPESTTAASPKANVPATGPNAAPEAPSLVPVPAS